MSSFAMQRNIGAYLKLRAAIATANAAAGAITGPAIDRQGFESCVLQVACGAASGGPSARTVDCKLTHCDTSGGSYVDVPSAALTQMTADGGDVEKNIDLIGVKRFIKVVVTVAFTGGSSPAIPVSAAIALGGAVELPA